MFDVAVLSPGGQISGFCTYLSALLLLYKASTLGPLVLVPNLK